MASLLWIFAAAAMQTEPPNTSSEEESVIMWVAASSENCNISVAQKLPLEALSKQPDRWAGKCVAVTGYWYGRALFMTPSDARRRNSQSTHELDGRRLGIYGRNEVLERAPKRPEKFFAIGIANTCERLSDGAIMVMGYCHYTDGPMIAVAEMRQVR